MGDGHALTNGCSKVASALGKAMSCRHRICNSCSRLVAGQGYALTAIAWRDLANLVGADQLRIDALLLLHAYVSAQGFCSLFIRQNEHTRCYKAAIAANVISEMLENGQAVLCHAHGEVIGVVLPDNGS